MQTADRYSRLISWLKVVLPLMALALLSTLFLLSRVIDPEAVIPFAEKEIQDRLRDQQVTGPFFAGTTADGDQISFTAEKLSTRPGEAGANQAEDVLVVVETIGGAVVSMRAAMARFDIAADKAELTGDVRVTTSAGYKVESALLIARMSSLEIHSPGLITAEGPPGMLQAGRMEITAPKQGAPLHLVFKNRVKLIYMPKQDKE